MYFPFNICILDDPNASLHELGFASHYHRKPHLLTAAAGYMNKIGVVIRKILLGGGEGN